MSDLRNLLDVGFSPEHEAVLQQTIIDERSPGPLLTNIQNLIDEIGTGITTSSAYFALPQRVLAKLNESMVDPLAHELKRPQLRSFPTLTGLFVLLRGAGLAIGETKPKRAIRLDPVMLEQWQALNPTERYFNLLATGFYKASWSSVEKERYGRPGLLNNIRSTYMSFRKKVTVLSSDRSGLFDNLNTSVTACLLHQFGWLRMDYNTTPNPGKAATPRRVERTEFGDAMFIATCQLGAYESERTEVLHEKLQPFFPAWTQILTAPEPEFREGNHTFKVSLGEAWRRIIAPADADLEQLADAILEAFRFDDEHPYQFELRDAAGLTITIAGPYLEDGQYFAEEMRVGEVPLPIGESMVLHYDFGEDWLFNVTLESVKEGKAKKLKVTAKGGKPPKQYDDPDEW